MGKLGEYPAQPQLPPGNYKGIVKEVKSFVSKANLRGLIFTFLTDYKYPTGQLGEIAKFQMIEGHSPQNTAKILGMFNGFLEDCGVPEEIRHQIETPPQARQIGPLLEGHRFNFDVVYPDGPTGYPRVDVLACLDEKPEWKLVPMVLQPAGNVTEFPKAPAPVDLGPKDDMVPF